MSGPADELIFEGVKPICVRETYCLLLQTLPEWYQDDLECLWKL